MNNQAQENESLSTLNDIRSIMERSTRFLSLSGWSGIWAGIVALIGGTVSYYLLESYSSLIEETGEDRVALFELRNTLFYLGLSVFIVALGGAFLFTIRKVKQQGLNIWNSAAKKFLLNLLVPIVAGAVMIISFLHFGDWQYVVPACLIFYGLGLISASKFTLDDIRYLGIIEVILGSLSLFMPGLGLYFWSFGFGIMHIVYGILMWRKYDKISA